MFYTIASDIPGRLSIRCDRRLFSESEARGITLHLLGIEGVQHATVRVANGCIVVDYRSESRDKILRAIDSLDTLNLPTLDESAIEVTPDIEAELENVRFAHKAFGIVFWHYVRRFLLPSPIRAIITVMQAAQFIARGLASLARGRLTVEVLDATAIAASLIRGSFSDAAAIMMMLKLTDALEQHVQKRVHIAFSENLITRPETVWALSDGEYKPTPLASIYEGQHICINAGQVLPVDGTVISGAAEVDESSMTGESTLVAKEQGATVYAGTAVESGEIVISVTAVAGKSRIDDLVSLVTESTNRKAHAQANAEKIADGLVPVSFMSFFAILAITRSLATAMTVLLVDYSCAVRLALPICVMAAMSESTERGVVVKGGRHLETLAKADTVVFDKTGTLTLAKPKVERILPFGTMDEDSILRYAACIEEHFPHSVARAIVDAAREKGLDHNKELHASVEYVVAHGIKTQIGDKQACIGSGHFVFQDENVKKPRGMAVKVRNAIGDLSAIYLAVNGKLEGVIGINDPLRPEAAAAIEQLRESGIDQIVMLTGDAAPAAQLVARQLGIDTYHAQVLPEHKKDYIDELKSQGRTVIMVGDGINDSPALAAADVSIALADASDIARAVADVSVLDASLEKIITMRHLSTLLMERIAREYRAIITFNTSLIVLGVAGILPLTAAAWLHNLSTFAISAASTRNYLGRN